MRIASLSPAITEILFAFELQDQIVCTDQFSNYPEAAQDIPHIKDHMNIDPAELREYGADLVFTSTVIQEKLAKQLEAHDFSVMHQDPRTINGIYECIRNLGMVLDKDKEAEAVVVQMQQGFNDLKKKAALLPTQTKLYIEEWHEPPMASGNWVSEVARVAGGVQFPIQPGELSREVSLDEVWQHDPDLVVISWCGAGPYAEPELLTKREGWGELRAVEQGNVRVIDDSLLNRPGPRLVEGAQRLYGWMFEMQH